MASPKIRLAKVSAMASSQTYRGNPCTALARTCALACRQRAQDPHRSCKCAALDQWQRGRGISP
eukprot:10342814-Alexandrium_andersonii.AAC.1